MKQYIFFLLCLVLLKTNAQSLKSTRVLDDSLSFASRYLDELYTINVYKDKYISNNGITSFKHLLFVKVEKDDNFSFFNETKIKIGFDKIRSITCKKGIIRVTSSNKDITLLKITEFNKYLRVTIPYELRRKHP